MNSSSRQFTRLTRWLQALLCLYVVILTIAVVSDFFELLLINDIANGVSVTAIQTTTNDTRQASIAVTQAIVFIIAGILFLSWIYRANQNLRAGGVGGLQFSPGWAIGWYFVPVWNLWKPYQAMKELWQASASDFNLHWSNQQPSALIGWWWFLWLVSTILGRIAGRLLVQADEIGMLQAASLANLASDLWDIILTVAALMLVIQIHRRQEVKRLSQQGLELLSSLESKSPDQNRESSG